MIESCSWLVRKQSCLQVFYNGFQMKTAQRKPEKENSISCKGTEILKLFDEGILFFFFPALGVEPRVPDH